MQQMGNLAINIMVCGEPMLKISILGSIHVLYSQCSSAVPLAACRHRTTLVANPSVDQSTCVVGPPEGQTLQGSESAGQIATRKKEDDGYVYTQDLTNTHTNGEHTYYCSDTDGT